MKKNVSIIVLALLLAISFAFQIKNSCNHNDMWQLLISNMYSSTGDAVTDMNTFLLEADNNKSDANIQLENAGIEFVKLNAMVQAYNDSFSKKQIVISPLIFDDISNTLRYGRGFGGNPTIPSVLHDGPVSANERAYIRELIGDIERIRANMVQSMKKWAWDFYGNPAMFFAELEKKLVETKSDPRLNTHAFFWEDNEFILYRKPDSRFILDYMSVENFSYNLFRGRLHAKVVNTPDGTKIIGKLKMHPAGKGILIVWGIAGGIVTLAAFHALPPVSLIPLLITAAFMALGNLLKRDGKVTIEMMDEICGANANKQRIESY